MRKLVQVTAVVFAVVATGAADDPKQAPMASQAAPATTPALTFEKFHDYAAQVALIRHYARTYPKLVKLDTYGKSFQGRDLHILSITNSETGAIESKPAMWMDAGYDGGEIQTTEILLVFLDQLLAGYGKNAQITELLDRIGFYILPNGNPDAGEQFYQKPAPGPKAGPFMGVSRNAWLKPVDDDDDGRLDEDPPEDLDADGMILQMRMKDPNGAYVTDQRDPRLMRVRKPWEKGEWRVISSEGIDSDGDGEFNEDWYGGYDSNRNAPANWDPMRIMEAPAPYPLYLPEVKHFIDAILARPNIFAMINMHQSGIFPGGSLWEAPTSAPPEQFPDHDMKVLYPLLGREYERLMRKAPHSKDTAMSVYIGYGQRGRVLSGVMTDYGYINLGILTWSPEHNVVAPDYNDDGTIGEDERMKWNDTELKEKIFVPWHAFNHPQLGKIEIGGWRQRGAAPAELMPWHAERITPWYLEVAAMAPLLRIMSATAQRTASVVSVRLGMSPLLPLRPARRRSYGWWTRGNLPDAVRPGFISAR